jgi:hypothetical protein
MRRNFSFYPLVGFFADRSMKRGFFFVRNLKILTILKFLKNL